MLGNRYAMHSFSQMPEVNKPRSKFNLSHTVKTTILFDQLIPFYVQEILPGDTFTNNVSAFLRLATSTVPLMDNLYCDFFFFAVPNRLTYDNWQRLMGEKPTPASSTDFVMPQLTAPAGGGFTSGSIYDYFGLPTKINSYLVKNTTPLRAYNLIWNEWFRDENLQDPVTVPTDAGPDTPGTYGILKRGKRHDRFTSCLPWPQKGTAVSLPLGTTAPIIGTGATPGNILGLSVTTTGNNIVAGSTIRNQLGTTKTLGSGAGQGVSVTSGLYADMTGTGAVPASSTNVPNIRVDPATLLADLSTATAATINSLRQAWMVQTVFETDARYGTRYVESIYGHFGVISPDFRLQRPEYLGGGEIKFNSHPIAQTSATEAGNSPQATLSAFATGLSKGNIGFSKSFVEHSVVIGLMSCRADITYQYGAAKIWDKSSRFDFYTPELANIGEQPVLNKEIYAQGTAADNQVFGYQEAWSDYRSFTSLITGDFRSNHSTPLDQWHMADKYTSLPTLSSAWITSDTPIARNIAVNPVGFSTAQVLVDIFHDIKASRVMPVRSVPATIGRF